MTQKKTYCNSRVRKALAAIVIDYSIALIDGLHCRTCRFANTVRIFPAIRGDSTWLFCEACRNSGSVIDYAKDGLTKRVLLSDEQNNRSRRRRKLQAACEKAVRLLGQHTGDLDTAPGLATAAHIYTAPQRDWDLAFMDQCILQQRKLNLTQDVTTAKANKSKLTNLFSRVSPQPIAFGREESKTAAIAQYCGIQAAPAIDFDFDLPIPVLLNNLLSAVPSVAERYACVQS